MSTALPLAAMAEPYQVIGGQNWSDALAEGRLQPVPPPEWDAYMGMWQFPDEGEPYPPNDYVPAAPPTGELYLWEGGGPDWPERPGLVMYWEPQGPGSWSSAWKLLLGDEGRRPAQPPFNLSATMLSVTVTAPQFDLNGNQINAVSFGLQDIAGLYRSWYWNVGPPPAPIPWNMPTTISINLSQIGVAAAIPTANGYASQPGFNLAACVALVADENAQWVGGPTPIPPPGGPPGVAWNYWHNVTVAPLGGGPGGGLPGHHGPASFSVNGPVEMPASDGVPPPGTPYYAPPWIPPPPPGAGPYGMVRQPPAPPALGIATSRPGDVNDYWSFGMPSEAEIFQSEPDLNPAAGPSGTCNQIIQAPELGLGHGGDNVNAYSFGEDFVPPMDPIGDDLPITDEPWADRAGIPGFMEPFVAPGIPTVFYFSVDPFAIGSQGTAVRLEATLQGSLFVPAGPPGTTDVEVTPGFWQSDGEAGTDIFFAFPATAPGLNFLDHDDAPLALLAPRLIGMGMDFEDDLDALEHMGANAAGQSGNTHDRVAPIPGTHPPELGDPFSAMHEPAPLLPLIFSVDRWSYGAPGSAVASQVNAPVDGASGDLFVAYTLQPPSPFAGLHTNLLLIDEGQLGLMPHDDLDAVIVFLLIDPAELETRMLEASFNFDPGESFGPGFTEPLLHEGEALVGFSVDVGSIGLVGTAVDYECRVDGLGLVGPGYAGSGVMEQAGDVFYSDLRPPPGQMMADPGTGLLYGRNYLWQEETSLGLDAGAWTLAVPPATLADAPDDLNALDSLEDIPEELEACCLPDGTCQDLTATDCTGLGGVPSLFHPACLGDLDGNGVDDACECACNGDLDGNGIINLADVLIFVACFGQPPTGQCAGADYDCDGDIELDDFASFHCLFYGYPREFCCDSPNGACCLADGTCRQVPLAECAALGGSYAGDGSVCGAIAPEACCQADGVCTMADPFCCASQLGGTPLGEGSTCGPVEACCLPDGSCADLDPACCVELDGLPGGAGTACSAPEPCCLDDGSCLMTDPICCAQINGSPSPTGSSVCLGDTNGSGTDDACEIAEVTQACCLPDGGCAVLTHTACVDAGGDPQGPQAGDCNGVECSPIKWSQPPLFNPASPHPECFWGWDELSVYGLNNFFVADDWLCETGAPISDIHWWGSYMSWEGVEPPPIAPAGFHIGIWTDVPAGIDSEFSHPGVLLHEWSAPREMLNERPVACDFHPQFMDTPDGCFKYDFRAPVSEWFVQDDACNIFWVSISAYYAGSEPGCACVGDVDQNGFINLADAMLVVQLFGCDVAQGGDCALADVNCDGVVDPLDESVVECQIVQGFPDPACCTSLVDHPWGWKTRERHFGDDAVRVFEPGMPHVGMAYEFGEPIELPPGVSWDTSFVLTTSACPIADTPVPEVYTSGCTTDADCQNLAVCRSGDCYVPLNKYLTFDPMNGVQPTAIRVTMTASTSFPGFVGESWWVEPHDPADRPGLFRLGCVPFYHDWSVEPPVIMVGDREIVPGSTYEVTMIHEACDPSDPGSYSPPLSLPTPPLWADCIGQYDMPNTRWTPPQGVVNLVDVQAAVFGFQGSSQAPPIPWVDLDGDPPNGVLNLVDAQRIAIAFSSGSAYPYAGPVACP